MKHLNDIMELLGITMDQAQFVMDRMSLDFSEASKEEFEFFAELVYKMCKVNPRFPYA